MAEQRRVENLLPEPCPPTAKNSQPCASRIVLKCSYLRYKEMFLFKQNSLLSLFPFSHLAQYRGLYAVFIYQLLTLTIDLQEQTHTVMSS